MCRGQYDGICAYAQNMPKGKYLDYNVAKEKMNDLVNHGYQGTLKFNNRAIFFMANSAMQDVEVYLCIPATTSVKDNSQSTSAPDLNWGDS
jgi:hypothetical protein